MAAERTARGWAGAVSLTPAAVILLLLNLADGVFTTAYLQLGVAEEANPLMRLAWERSPLTFMAVKLVVVSAGVLVLALYRDAKPARWALGAAVALYAVILVWHLAFLAHLVVQGWV